jgi:hypothetical protein
MTSNITINLSKIPGFHLLKNDGYTYELTNVLKLNNVECNIEKTDNSQKYKVIGYDKKLLEPDMRSTYGLCRSIVVNSDDNKVVCFSPPKSIPYASFIETYTYTPDNRNIIAQELVEGTMINVFWEEKKGLTGGWEISTKNTVGGTSAFYRTNNRYKTFRDMFIEAVEYIHLDLNLLDKNYSYSFVLQHPENRIVVPFEYPMLYLVAAYSIDNRDENNVTVTIHEADEFKMSDAFISSWVAFPSIYNYTTYDELCKNYASDDTPYNILGFVLYNRETGERTKVRNPAYEEVRRLRGNQSKLQYHYLCLRRENKVASFLNFFPEYRQTFTEYRNQIHAFTNNLFGNYISCYIKKEKKLIEFSQEYRTHMFHLHQKYKDELKELNLYVTKSVVINYVNEIHPTLLMHCININFLNLQ